MYAVAGAGGGILIPAAFLLYRRLSRNYVPVAPAKSSDFVEAAGVDAKSVPRRRSLLLEAEAAQYMDTHPRADKASKAAKTPRADAKLVAAEDSPQQPHRPPPQEAWAAPPPPTRRASLDYDSRPKAPPSPTPAEIDVEPFRPPRETKRALGDLGGVEVAKLDWKVDAALEPSKTAWADPSTQAHRRPRPPDTWGLAPRSRHRRVLSSGAMVEAMDLGEDFPTYGEPVKAYHATGGARWDTDDQLVYGRSYAVYDSSRAALASPSSKPVARGKRDAELFTFD